MAQKIKIQGQLLNERPEPPESEYSKIIKSFSLQNNCSNAGIIDIGVSDDDIIYLELKDGVEWIRNLDDIHLIFNDLVKFRDDDAIFPSGRSINNPVDRVIIKDWDQTTSYKT